MAGAGNVNTAAAQGLQGAAIGTGNAMGYTPGNINVGSTTPNVTASGTSPTIGVSGTAPQVTAGQLANTNMAQYMNPYTDQVIKANESDIMRGATQGMNMLGGQANAASAYGGSRHGVAMGELGRDTVDQLAQSSAGLRQAGYQNAQQAAQQDISGNMQAALANQAAGQFDITNQMQAGLANQQGSQFDAQQGMQAQLANQQGAQSDIQTRLQAALANQSAGLQGNQQRMGASSQMGNLSNLGFGMGQTVTSNLERQGAQQQAMQQALIDSGKQRFQRYTAQPQNSLGYVTQAIGASPVPQTQTTSKQPGLFDYMTLAATAYPSDRRLKKNITKMGQLKSGLNIYKWEWIDGAKELGADMNHTLGVIAQEAKELFPNAVVKMDNGYYAVKYAELR